MDITGLAPPAASTTAGGRPSRSSEGDADIFADVLDLAAGETASVDAPRAEPPARTSAPAPVAKSNDAQAGQLPDDPMAAPSPPIAALNADKSVAAPNQGVLPNAPAPQAPTNELSAAASEPSAAAPRAGAAAPAQQAPIPSGASPSPVAPAAGPAPAVKASSAAAGDAPKLGAPAPAALVARSAPAAEPRRAAAAPALATGAHAAPAQSASSSIAPPVIAAEASAATSPNAPSAIIGRGDEAPPSKINAKSNAANQPATPNAPTSAATAAAKPAAASKPIQAGADAAKPAAPAPAVQLGVDAAQSDQARTSAPPPIELPADARSGPLTNASSPPSADRAGQAARMDPGAVAAFAMRFARRTAEGASRFELRLDPPELGRVDVRVEIDANGKARAHLIVERPEALAELSRNARQLERALAEAGVDVSDDGLEFELARDGADGFRTRDDDLEAPLPGAAERDADEPADAPLGADAEIEIDAGLFAVLRRGRLDIRA